MQPIHVGPCSSKNCIKVPESTFTQCPNDSDVIEQCAQGVQLVLRVERKGDCDRLETLRLHRCNFSFHGWTRVVTLDDSAFSSYCAANRAFMPMTRWDTRARILISGSYS